MDTAAFVRDLLLVALFGGAVGLDRRGAFQLMVSQPLVAVPALGLLLGDVETGLWLGSLLQLLWMSSFLFGAQVPPNETVASISIGGMVLLYGRYEGPPTAEIWTLAILLGAPLSLLGRWVDIRLDRANLGLASRADAAAHDCAPRVLGRIPVIGLVRVFALNAVMVAPAAGLGLVVLSLVAPHLDGAAATAVEAVGHYFLPALGLAVALSTVRRRRALALAAASFTLVLVALQQTRGL